VTATRNRMAVRAAAARAVPPAEKVPDVPYCGVCAACGKKRHESRKAAKRAARGWDAVGADLRGTMLTARSAIRRMLPAGSVVLGFS
jgi:hypothetical protein